MFFQCSTEPFYIDNYIIKRFVASCHWQYLRKYNLFGHHNLGWGFAYLDEKDNLKVRRDITPIYKSDWKRLTKIKTSFLLVHARKAYPWNRSFKNIHPINIGEKYLIVHNGVIKTDSFPYLNNVELEKIRLESTLDTRRYLCFIMDNLKSGSNLKNSLEKIFETIEIAAGANAFLFNAQECNIICHHNTNFNGRHHTLFINKSKDSLFVSTTPILKDSMEIPNNALIRINLKNLEIDCNKLEIYTN
jgi:predicted glutamine amidotransferase